MNEYECEKLNSGDMSISFHVFTHFTITVKDDISSEVRDADRFYLYDKILKTATCVVRESTLSTSSLTTLKYLPRGFSAAEVSTTDVADHFLHYSIITNQALRKVNQTANRFL